MKQMKQRELWCSRFFSLERAHRHGVEKRSSANFGADCWIVGAECFGAGPEGPELEG